MIGRSEILYIGKAGDLRKRLASYAHFSGPSHSKTAIMLAKIQRIETILTSTEKEALILEASLIKKHKPKYNIILRDDKNYPFIKVTLNEKWPRILVTRKRLQDGNRYFGPFASALAMRSTLNLLYYLFPLRRCKTIRSGKRPCLNHQLKRCLAPCSGEVSEKTYNELVRQTLLVLEGRNDELIKILEQKMQSHAKNLAFEKAAAYRDQINSLKRTLEKQIIVSDHFLDQDIFGLARKDASVVVAVLFVRSGKINGAQTFLFSDPIGSNRHILSKALLQFYSPQRQPPQQILLPMKPEDEQLLEERLSELRPTKTIIQVPRKGKRKQLITMAVNNASQVFNKHDEKKKSWENLSAALQKKLQLHRLPGKIECVDISNTGGRQAVGSIVCALNGEMFHKGYRRFKIRQSKTPDDYAMMHEVLTRRFSKTESENVFPDLLVIDGGKGQLNVAEKILEKDGLSVRVELVAIAKEKNNEGEKIFRPARKNPIILKRHDPVLLFLMRIRDESHGFGIRYHRKLRAKKTFRSQLDDIKSVGQKRRELLLTTFGSIKRIKNATPEKLCQVPGIGPQLALSIYNQLHKK